MKIEKVLVANRGEIAVRVMRACQEMGISTAAVYSEADREMPHVAMADEAYCIGEPAPSESYLNMDKIIAACKETGAQAVHPGYGFLSENSKFAKRCESEGITFIGPSAETISLMGDKIQAKQLARSAHVPTAPGSEGVVETVEDAVALAEQIEYPVALKAAAGGGGRGIRMAHNEATLRNVFKQVQSEAQAAFKDGRLYLEKCFENFRHIEVQILGDVHGHIVHLFERECSLQRRRQKVIEETPAVNLEPDMREEICEAAVRLAEKVGYFNAGTVEFMLDVDTNEFYFLEMNTRIQVEHPVTEMVTGLDLVKEQIRIAYGHKLGRGQRDVERRGHAIECRITAEDHTNRFLASGGTVESLILPGGPGVRVDTHLYPGYTIPPFYDALLAKLVVWAPTRAEAIARAARALAEFEITGLKTTIPFHREVLANAYFRRGERSPPTSCNTGWGCCDEPRVGGHVCGADAPLSSGPRRGRLNRPWGDDERQENLR